MAEHPRHRQPSHLERSGGERTGAGETYHVRETSEVPVTSRTYRTEEAPEHRYTSHHEAPRHYDSSREHAQESQASTSWWNIGRRISWGAIFAGVAVALAVQLLLSMLGIGIGAAGFDPAQGDSPTAWSIGAGVWWVITGLIALFVGGWVAGHLSSNPDRTDGMLHGVVTWSLATLIGVWLLTSTLGAVTAGAWQVVATGAESGAVQQLQLPAQAQEQVEQLQQPQQQQELQQQAQEVAQQADDAVAHAGIWTFIAMLLGAAAAGLGGFLATPSNSMRELNEREYRNRERR